MVKTLDGAGIEYMVTGSMASSAQGEPRFSHDIDLVVALKKEHVADLLRSFPAPEYYLSEPAAIVAIEKRQMFNLIDVTGGEKVDFWLLTDDAFDQARFARRQLAELDGIRFYISSPEDTILAKLRWAKMCGGSEKQMHDALRVYELQRPVLDIAYISAWVVRLDLRELWKELQQNGDQTEFSN